MPTMEVSGTGFERVSIRKGMLPVNVSFRNSSDTTVSVRFEKTPPFTDNGNPFNVYPLTTVVKVVASGTKEGHNNFSSSTGRTGDIEITA